MHRLKLAAIAVALLTGAIGATAYVEAYNNYDNLCWWVNSSPMPITYNWGQQIGSFPQWQTAFQNARNAWIVAPVKPYFTYDAGSANSFDTYWAGDNHGGYTWTWCDVNWHRINFYAKGNTFYPETDSWAQGIAGHEEGHGFGLGHSSDSGALMNPNQNFGAINTPQSDDINGINAMYPW